MLPSKDLSNMTSMQFFRCISHTAVMNVAQYLGITGAVVLKTGYGLYAGQGMNGNAN